MKLIDKLLSNAVRRCIFAWHTKVGENDPGKCKNVDRKYTRYFFDSFLGVGTRDKGITLTKLSLTIGKMDLLLFPIHIQYVEAKP